jgi:hypothetical protein
MVYGIHGKVHLWSYTNQVVLRVLGYSDGMSLGLVNKFYVAC